MADKKITELNPLAIAAFNDVFAIVDILTGETKKISLLSLLGSPGPIGSINPGTAEFTTLEVFAGSTINEFSVDGTLSGDSDSVLPTEKAVKTYVDTQIGGAVNHNSTTGLQGGDSTNSEYYHLTESIYNGLFSESPTIGLGSSIGTNFKVDYGSHAITAIISGSTQATINANGLTLAFGASVNEFSIDGTLIGNSDDSAPTEKAVKTYVDTEITVLRNQLDLINVRFVSSDSTAIAGDIVLVDTTAGNVNIDLIESSDSKIIIKKITTDVNDVIISTSPGTIDGNANVTIDTVYQSYAFVSNGSDFYII